MPKRYFEELSDEKRIKAGAVSEELRVALNLHQDKLPIWIYRMRVLGYPPGWLQEADISASTMTIVDDNVPVAQPSQESVTYNPESLIEYPGFNAPIPEGVQDHCQFLGMPPMLPHQQLTFAKKTMSAPKPIAFKRIRLSATPSSASPAADTPKEDTDLKDSETSTCSVEIIESPCIEPQDKNGVLAAANSIEEGEVLVVEVPDKVPDDSEQVVGENGNVGEARASKSSIESIPEAKDISITDGETPEPTCAANINNLSGNERRKLLKLISVGSPVPLSYLQKKPPLENFAEGMSELIYFENLPTSTGVFDKMRGVLSNIRRKLSG